MNNTFTVDQNGTKVVYKVLLTFFNEGLNRHYVVYTDETQDENGNLNILVSSYNPEEEHSSLLPVRSEEEWQTVTKALEDFNDELNAQIEALVKPAMDIKEDPRQRTYVQDGITYQVLAVFTNEQNGDEYAIYTDETPADANKEKEVLIGRIVDQDGDDIKAIQPIETVEEWEMIREPATSILKHLNNQ